MICMVIGMLEVPQIVHQFCSCMLVSVLKIVHSLAYLSYVLLVLFNVLPTVEACYVK